jgi:DNA repair protein RecN (Recombination protein N)
LIEEIVIRDLGVIREAKLELGAGLTVLTGETGAGKTMVLNALGLLLGERSDQSSIRKGAEQSYVEGRWLLSPETVARIQQAGVEIEDDELILSRSVSTEGRSRAAISGRSVAVGVLAEIGEQLVVVHGQADQIRLRSQTAQREALDQFAGESIAKLLQEYEAVYSNWKITEAQLSELSNQLDARLREADEIRAAVLELGELDPQPAEDQQLAEAAERLTHLEDLRRAAQSAHEELSSESSESSADALTLIGRARRALEAVSHHDPELSALAESLREIGFSLNETSANLSGYLASLDSEGPNELERIQERRAALAQAMRRYGPSLEEVISYRDKAGARLMELDSSSDEIDRLRIEEAALHKKATELAGEISQERHQAAKLLASSVSEELAALAMSGATLEVQVRATPELTSSGADQVSILLSAYPGAEPRPLGKGASGGELSRIMLAIEVVLAKGAIAPTFVFDEVDAGVGGAAASEVGKRLAALAKNAQVVVVTHLPQVAAYANRHLRVLKSTSDEFTASDVVTLSGEEIVSELARMLSGLSESETGRSHAQELLDLAQGQIAS